MQSLELASIVSQKDTHLLANIVFTCKHCEILSIKYLNKKSICFFPILTKIIKTLNFLLLFMFHQMNGNVCVPFGSAVSDLFILSYTCRAVGLEIYLSNISIRLLSKNRLYWFLKVSDQQILFDSEPEIEHEDQQHNTQILNKIK